MFLSGMLDVTDNIVGGEVVAPDRVVRYDDDDPYLVVAADKGTATFSDIANEVSAVLRLLAGRRVRLRRLAGLRPQGDGDHRPRRLGVGQAPLPRARHRHPADRLHGRRASATCRATCSATGCCSRATSGWSARSTTCTCSSIPTPTPSASYEERKRLFELPRSSWGDYDESLISEGGGVYPRTREVDQAVRSRPARCSASRTRSSSPNELIQAILRGARRPALERRHRHLREGLERGERRGRRQGQRRLRVDGDELRCKVVGEGGNLGFTQRARIEYALAGGTINTDAIDNVAGVNCSDHEVNIKILLGGAGRRRRHDLQAAQRAADRDDRRGRRQVLYGSYTQTQAMSLALAQAAPMVDVHARLIHHLEQVAGLDRELEFLPVDDDDRRAQGRPPGAGRARAGAWCMAYCKIHLYAQLLESDLPEDPYLAHDLERYFPPPLPERYSDRDAVAPAEPRDHRDRRGQPARRPRRHHVRLPPARGDRRPAVDTGARVRGRA